MDVFSFRDRVIEGYGQFSRSFTQIKALDLQQFVDGSYGKGEYWPLPLKFNTAMRSRNCKSSAFTKPSRHRIQTPLHLSIF